MNERNSKFALVIFLFLSLSQIVVAESAQNSVQQANKLYAQGNFNEAINRYDQALVENPQALEPKFNKANSYYRMDDLAKALDLYREVAAESKDMNLVAGSKYNLGNTYFQRGMKQRDSDLQKALEDLRTGIVFWHGVLDIEPENEKAAKNIEVTRLIIKDILDQLKNQQDPNQPQDPNQSQNQNQQQQQQSQDGSQQDPNQTQQQQDPNESQGKDPEQKEQKEQQKDAASDTTADEILDKEQQKKKMRQLLQRRGYQKVEKDW